MDNPSNHTTSNTGQNNLSTELLDDLSDDTLDPTLDVRRTVQKIEETFNELRDVIIDGVRVRCLFDSASFLGYMFIDLPDTLPVFNVESPLKDRVMCYLFEFRYPFNRYSLLPFPDNSEYSLHYRAIKAILMKTSHLPDWTRSSNLRSTIPSLIAFIKGANYFGQPDNTASRSSTNTTAATALYYTSSSTFMFDSLTDNYGRSHLYDLVKKNVKNQDTVTTTTSNSTSNTSEVNCEEWDAMKVEHPVHYISSSFLEEKSSRKMILEEVYKNDEFNVHLITIDIILQSYVPKQLKVQVLPCFTVAEIYLIIGIRTKFDYGAKDRNQYSWSVDGEYTSVGNTSSNIPIFALNIRNGSTISIPTSSNVRNCFCFNPHELYTCTAQPLLVETLRRNLQILADTNILPRNSLNTAELLQHFSGITTNRENNLNLVTYLRDRMNQYRIDKATFDKKNLLTALSKVRFLNDDELREHRAFSQSIPRLRDGSVDFGPQILGSLAEWRKYNPTVQVANIEFRKDLSDGDFQHLQGIKVLRMRGCNQSSITDKAFVHLQGIHTLDMTGCNQTTISDIGLVYLKYVQHLDMSLCNQSTITDKAFINLKEIDVLNISGCNQPTITDEAFTNLERVRILKMGSCTQTTITNIAFAFLKRVKTLNISSCNQSTITNKAFVHLTGVEKLIMNNCNPNGEPNAITVTEDGLRNLQHIKFLDIRRCGRLNPLSESLLTYFRNMKAKIVENDNDNDGYTKVIDYL